MTAREVARMAGVHERTIRRAIARGELAATRHGGQFRIAPASFQEYQRQRAVSAEPRPTSRSRRVSPLGLLPVPPTALIGREQEMARAVALLTGADGRLLTLTGPGGVGKTRLGLAVAIAVAPTLADGAVFIPLDAIRDPELLAPAIAHRLGLTLPEGRPLLATLTEALRPRQQLLILDSFEHLLTAAMVVAELLAAAPGLRMLVTSREALRVRGENELVVPPLDLPDMTAVATPETISRSPAVELFVRRARAVQSDFSLTDVNAPVVGAICQRLDGLPLAIELAAAHIKHSPPAALLTRLDRRLDLLADGPRDLPPRLQTMRAAISWSVELLAPAEHALFRRLAVFPGEFDADAATWVAHDQVDVTAARQQMPTISVFRPVADDASLPSTRLPAGASAETQLLLSSLVDKSLLQMKSLAGETRSYQMLETIREFAGERLSTSGEDIATRDRHAAYSLAIAAEAMSHYHAPTEGEAYARLDANLGNIRAAFTWVTVEGRDLATGLQLANALWWFWYVRGHHREGLQWYQSIIHDPRAEAWPAALAEGVVGAGYLAIRQLMTELARMLHRDALERFRDLHDDAGAAFAMVGLGLTALYGDGDPVTAATIIHEALPHVPATHRWQQAASRFGLILAALALNDIETAQSTVETTLAISRADGDEQGMAASLSTLGFIARQRDEPATALQFLRESLGHFQHLDDRGNICTCVEPLAGVLVALGRAEQGAFLFGAAAAMRQSIGTPVLVLELPGYQADLAAAREAMGAAAFAATFAAGEETTLRDAISGVAWNAPIYSATGAPVTAGGATLALSTLTPRQREVLELIGAGHTDRQIGELLSISPDTVTKHVGNVLAKLGVHSRTAAAIMLLTASI